MDNTKNSFLENYNRSSYFCIRFASFISQVSMNMELLIEEVYCRVVRSRLVSSLRTFDASQLPEIIVDTARMLR